MGEAGAGAEEGREAVESVRRFFECKEEKFSQLD